MRFAVLGAVRAWRDGEEVDLGVRQPQLMTAMLVARAGRSVAVSELVDLLWPDEPPANALNSAQRHIGTIRRAIEPSLPRRAEGSWLVRRAGGYQLNLAADAVDLLRFRELGRHADAELRAGRRETAVAAYQEALRLWQGPFGEGLGAETHPLFVAVNRERTMAARALARAALSEPDKASLLPQVHAATDADPFDETLLARLLLLLAADGRPSEAIMRYHQFRERLADELGTAPGRELTGAFQTVLREPPTRRSDGTPPAGRPAQLPHCSVQFVGRRPELETLDRFLEEEERRGVTVIAVEGPPGIGKTAIAAHWSRSVAHRFPDGQFFLSLRGYADSEPLSTADALAHLLGSLGVPGGNLPTTDESRSALFRTLTVDQQLLIALDNARDAEQVRLLLPTGPGSLVIVTGRGRLDGLAATHGARLLRVDVPPADEARAQLLNRLGARALDDPREEAALETILRRTARLPLALAIVGTRAAAYAPVPLRDVAAELDRSSGLDAFVGDEAASDLRTAFAHSHRLLSPEAARLFAHLSRAGSEIDADATAWMSELVGVGLLRRIGFGRHAMHDLVRAYAAELATRDAQLQLVRSA